MAKKKPSKVMCDKKFRSSFHGGFVVAAVVAVVAVVAIRLLLEPVLLLSLFAI